MICHSGYKRDRCHSTHRIGEILELPVRVRTHKVLALAVWEPFIEDHVAAKLLTAVGAGVRLVVERVSIALCPSERATMG